MLLLDVGIIEDLLLKGGGGGGRGVVGVACKSCSISSIIVPTSGGGLGRVFICSIVLRSILLCQ